MQSLQDDIRQIIAENKTEIAVKRESGEALYYIQSFHVPAVGDSIEINYDFFVVTARQWEFHGTHNKPTVILTVKVENV